MNHHTANGERWIKTGWRGWALALAALVIALGTLWGAFMWAYPYSPFGVRDDMKVEHEARMRQAERDSLRVLFLEQRQDRQDKTNRAIMHYMTLSSAILTQPRWDDTPEVADAKRRMRRMFVIDPENGYEERGR